MKQENAYQITWLIRRLFRALGARADQYLKSGGLIAADRAIIEFLYPDLMLTVPQIARRYNVTRQHIQTTANDLLARGFLRDNENPKHKRSPLLSLSTLGRETLESIRRTEAILLRDLFAGVSDDDVQTAQYVLQTLLQKLDHG